MDPHSCCVTIPAHFLLRPLVSAWVSEREVGRGCGLGHHSKPGISCYSIWLFPFHMLKDVNYFHSWPVRQLEYSVAFLCQCFSPLLDWACDNPWEIFQKVQLSEKNHQFCLQGCGGAAMYAGLASPQLLFLPDPKIFFQLRSHLISIPVTSFMTISRLIFSR